MGVKPRSLAKRGKASVQISNSHGESIAQHDEPVGYPTDGSPHSTVAMRYGVRQSKPGTYASATMEIEVSLPCHPGEEAAAVDTVALIVNEAFAKYDNEFQEAVASL